MKSLASNSSGHIDIGYVFPLAKSYIPRLVRSFLNQQENHEITFSLSQEITRNLIADLKNEKYDVVFGSLVPDEPEVEFVPVVNQEMVIITPPEHPLKYKKDLVLEDLLDYPVIEPLVLDVLLIPFINKTISNLPLLLNHPMKMRLLLLLQKILESVLLPM